MIKFVIISGRSGSGKSTALHLLEDVGYTCIDNLPVSLLPALVTQMLNHSSSAIRFAIGIDARNFDGDLSKFPDILKATQLDENNCKIIYLDAGDTELNKRFSETRRKHPLTTSNIGLNAALEKEKTVLQPVASMADVTIDTTSLNLHQLRSAIKKQVVLDETGTTALSFESFGFKHGMPVDADFVFDVRCLPNPYWIPELRTLNGLDIKVAEFLEEQPVVKSMRDDIDEFIQKWLPNFESNNRSYLTIAIGCTGGMHRSVFLANSLGQRFKEKHNNVQINHRQLYKINH